VKQPQHITFTRAQTTPTQVVQWAQALTHLHSRIASRFARPEPRRRALLYLQGLLSATERKNGWQLAEQAREARPYGMQRLLSQAIWDTDGVHDDLREHVLEHLGQEAAIVVIDESSFPNAARSRQGSRSSTVEPPGTSRTVKLDRDLCPAHPSGLPSVGRTDPHDS